jgi:hypothetical protein
MFANDRFSAFSRDMMAGSCSHGVAPRQSPPTPESLFHPRPKRPAEQHRGESRHGT